MPRGVASTNREMAGSVAPISSVGGNSAIAQNTPLSSSPGMPPNPMAAYSLPMNGSKVTISTPHTPIPASSHAYTRSGCIAGDT